MHQVHTLNPDCTPTVPRPRTRRRVVACTGLYRGPPLGRVPGIGGLVAGLAGCIAARAPARSLRSITAFPSAVSRLYRDTTQRPTRAFVTIRPFVSRPSLPTARSSRVRRSPLRAGWPCRRPCWSYRGTGSAVSWPSPDRVVAPRLRPGHTSPAQCHDTIHCIVTQMGSSPFPISTLFFFSTYIFFLLIPATGKSPKTNFFFFISQ